MTLSPTPAPHPDLGGAPPEAGATSMFAAAAVALTLVVGGALSTMACGSGGGEGEGEKPVGSEGGPCTDGGGCDPGLTCLSDLCVDESGGEGEGEGEEGEGEGEGECQGDGGAQFDADDCDGIPAVSCGPIDENAVLATCRDAALILRNGIFNEVFPCLDAIPASACDAPNDELGACFSAINACPLPAANALCDQAEGACVGEGDTGFDSAYCASSLIPTNQAFREAWAQCFNDAFGEPCSSVTDFCYDFALATLIKANG